MCWGGKDAGPVTVPAGLANVASVSAGEYHTCAITIDGGVACWGANTEGQADVSNIR